MVIPSILACIASGCTAILYEASKKLGIRNSTTAAGAALNQHNLFYESTEEDVV